MAKSGRRLLAGIAVTVAGAGAGWLLQRALEPLVHDTDLRGAPPPCFELGAGFHHRFRAGCVDVQETPEGRVVYSINEDHLRSPPRAQVLARSARVLVLGDSIVEGWWAQAEEAIPALLGSRFPSVYFVNAGLRTTGPLQQAARLPALLRDYKPAAVLWLLNDSDLPDDRVACALRDGNGGFTLADFDPPGGWRGKLAGMASDSFFSRVLLRDAYRERRKALAASPAGGACGACDGVRGVVRAAREAKVPLLALHVELPPDPGVGATMMDPGARAVLGDCLKAAGSELHALPGPAVTPETRDGYHWPGDLHPTPAGSLAIVDEAAPVIASWLEKNGVLRNGGR